MALLEEGDGKQQVNELIRQNYNVGEGEGGGSNNKEDKEAQVEGDMDRTEGPEGPRSTTTKKHRLKGKWTGQRDQRDLEVQQQRSTG